MNMPTFYFDIVHSEGIVEDPEGDDLSGPQEALDHAAASARELVAQAALEGRNVLERHLQIRDEAGRVINCLRLGDALKSDDGGGKKPSGSGGGESMLHRAADEGDKEEGKASS